MPEETVTAPASSEAQPSLASLLGAPEVAEAPAESTTPGDTAEAEISTDDQQTGTAESAEEAEAEPTDESQIAPEEGEREYSDEVYARYAKHFSKQWGQTVDPQDPVHRAALREVIQRGENFRRIQAEATAAQEQEAPVEEEAPAEEEAAPAQDTPESIKDFMQQVDRFVEPRVRPEVAQAFLNDFMQALWPDQWKKMASKVSPEVGRQFTKGMMKFGYLFLNDALPQILDSYIPGLIENRFPGLDHATQDAIFEQAVDKIGAKVDRSGQPLYPDLDELIDSEAFNAVYAAHADLRDERYVDKRGRLLPPVEQEARRLERAIAYARGSQPPAPELMKQAVETGRQQVRKAQSNAALGKLAPGESSGQFGQVDTDTDALIKGMNQFGDRDRQIQDLLAPKK